MSADLIAKLESAQGPSRELDKLIAAHFFRKRLLPWLVPAYTSSFDAALTLIPSHKDYELTIMGTPDGKTFTCATLVWWAAPYLEDQKNWRSRMGNKLTPAMALCVAALRANEAIKEKP